MCNSAVHRPFNGVVDPFSFSTFHFLRTCNRLILPTDLTPYYSLPKDSRPFEPNLKSSQRESDHILQKTSDASCPELTSIFQPGCGTDVPHRAQLSNLSPNSSSVSIDFSTEFPLSSSHNRLDSLNYTNLLNRRQRGEKRPIPDEQKDEKYYERRKRNNEAAKKSRDARKLREDRIAFRAAILEQENAILRAQVAALREEMTALRQMMASRPSQI